MIPILIILFLSMLKRLNFWYIMDMCIDLTSEEDTYLYNILMLDDDQEMIATISPLLLHSGLNIQHIFSATTFSQGLDYIREYDIDLLITDLEVAGLNGIDDMQQVKLIKPSIEIIVVSTHNTFEYAQAAIRLGVKNYLIKPLELEPFLDSVREVLLHVNIARPAIEHTHWAQGNHFQMQRHTIQNHIKLNQLFAPHAYIPQEESVYQSLGLHGPYYAMIKIQYQPLTSNQVALTVADHYLLNYAVMNLAVELVHNQWNSVTFETDECEVNMIMQWDETSYLQGWHHKIRQLNQLGQLLHNHINNYLHIPNVIGISQILKGNEFINQLNIQAHRALMWHTQYPDHHVFYYGDMYWKKHEVSEPTAVIEENKGKNPYNLIVSQVKAYIEKCYGQKGLTIHDVAKKNHVSPNYLSYLFKKNTGFNLWEYVIKLRMEESRNLLLETDLRRYEVAERVGYESPEHFSKIFKRYYGISPSEFKQLQA